MTTIGWVPGYTMTPGVFAECWQAMGGFDHCGIELPGQGEDAHNLSDLRQRGWQVAQACRGRGARVLVGLSYGSCVAVQAALNDPEAFDALVLAAPTLAGQPEDAAARAKFLVLRQLRAAGVPPAQLAQVWLADPPGIFTQLRTAHPARFARVRQDIATHSFAELATSSMAASTGAHHDDRVLQGLRVPTLVITGTRDMPIFRDNARRLADAPEVSVLELEGAGHLPLLEEPERCAEELGAWLHALVAQNSPVPVEP